MSGREVVHRVYRSLRVRLESRGFFSARKPPTPSLSCGHGFLAQSELAGIDGRPYIDAAEKLLSGQQNVFALTVDYGASGIDWNRDPLTGIVAPLKFGKLIDYRDEGVVGNIKYLWEPNRHLELVTIAQAFAISGSARYLQELGRRFDSWLSQCSYAKGVNWSSSLEVGIRLINWSLVWQFVGGHQSVLFKGEDGGNRLTRLLDSIYQHVHFIRNYYSRHSSANNHLIGEAAAVFVASCTWPFWSDLEKWGQEARNILIDSAEAQTHSDGVNREQAISYQQFVLDFFLLAEIAGRAQSAEFPTRYRRSLERMIEFIYAIIDVGGNIPMFGDADDGFVMRLSQERDFCPFRSLLATGAILFDRPDFAAKSGGLDSKTRILLSADSWCSAKSTDKLTVKPIRRAFPQGGYYILGQDLETEKEIRIIADAGPLGYLSIAAHGHADALSIVLSVSGREILVDPGTYSYHTQPLMRKYFRGTSAHNTVCIDGKDQSLQGGNFMWLRHARAKCTTFKYTSESSQFIGEHDGYTRLRDPLIHRRSITQEGMLVDVRDELICDGPHEAVRCWHFSEDCQVTLDGAVVCAENGPVRVWLRPLELVDDIQVLRGSEEPPGGWISRSFDVKQPASSVCFSNNIVGQSVLTTRIECEIS